MEAHISVDLLSRKREPCEKDFMKSALIADISSSQNPSSEILLNSTSASDRPESTSLRPSPSTEMIKWSVSARYQLLDTDAGISASSKREETALTSMDLRADSRASPIVFLMTAL